MSLKNCPKLQSLPKLPACAIVNAVGCPSLESLPLELDQLGRWVDYSECNKLAENNFLTSLLKQLPKSKGLSKLQHVVNIVVPAGDEEVRIWFPYYDARDPNVSFVVPPSPFVKQKLLGCILRVLLRAPKEAPFGFHYFFIDDVICNKIKKGVYVFPFDVNPSDVDHVWLLYIPQGYRGLQLQGSDEVEIPIDAYPRTLVKNWAIDLVYEADEIHKATDTLYQVVFNFDKYSSTTGF
ncbi:hypothetical protein RHMOL_Rhmol01G0098300 [Rhododendron molle]|uniref:Uncharacterized protein n=1 Tax=Rhododendron molle TaxID=49168 RepID=A0ACC0Q165_RHOML|nr:hypothetical protein RHMOL_Rhmol01G0098300 [Rhododendron molle]